MAKLFIQKPGTRRYFTRKKFYAGNMEVGPGFGFSVPPFVPVTAPLIAASALHAIRYSYRVGDRADADLTLAAHMGRWGWVFLLILALFEPVFEYYWRTDAATRRPWVGPVLAIFVGASWVALAVGMILVWRAL